MADISLKDAFDIYQKQSDSIHKLWAYFQFISLAVLGYTVGSEKSNWVGTTYVLIAVSYFIFAAANQWVIVFSQKELRKFGKAVTMISEDYGTTGRKFAVTAVPPWKVSLFHTFSALVILTAILVTWHHNCTAPATCPAPSTSEKKPS